MVVLVRYELNSQCVLFEVLWELIGTHCKKKVFWMIPLT